MNLIEKALKDRGLKPSEAATLLGISRGHMGDLIHGRRSPSFDLALKIERTWGINAARLNKAVSAVRVAA